MDVVHHGNRRNYKMCTFVTDKNYFPPFMESEISLPSTAVSTWSTQHVYQENFINRIKILTPTHQYIVSNTNPYNMKWSCKKGAVRGNTLKKFFCLYLVFASEDGA